jgi:hypothetical protein
MITGRRISGHDRGKASRVVGSPVDGTYIVKRHDRTLYVDTAVHLLSGNQLETRLKRQALVENRYACSPSLQCSADTVEGLVAA